MMHHSTWLCRPRLKRRTHLGAPLGFLLTCVLLAALPGAASATTTEMRGEWELVMTSGTASVTAISLITVEANGAGEFAASKTLFGGFDPGTFSGTLKGSEASVKVTFEGVGSFPPGEFTSTNMQINSKVGSLSMSGSGIVKLGKEEIPEKLVATRIKTYKEIEEREAQEKKEREEQLARQSIRGEWELTLSSGASTIKGQALIANAANAKNEFLSSSALFEGGIPGSFSGTLEGGKASVTIATQAAGPFPATEFTSKAMTVESSGGSLSMTGSGTGTLGPATLTAKRIKTHQQLEEQKAKEKEAKEKQEKEERATAERMAREQKEKELKERELKERQEREAAEKAKTSQNTKTNNPPPILASVLLGAKALTVGNGGSISLGLTNPNASPVNGNVKLTLAGASKASAKHGKSSTLGESSFSIAAHGSYVVKLKLSRSGRTALARRKTLHVVVTLTTQASGQPTTTKKFDLTLHATKAHSKH
jgi:hypothetical protein